jgi:uncharacterized protein YbjT (DUF2867 family)
MKTIDILILGATGNTGSLVVKQLKDNNANFGIMVRENQSTSSIDLSNDQIRFGDYDNLALMVKAMKGVKRLYLVMPMSPNTKQWVANVLVAAKQAGVEHIVKQSGMKASLKAGSKVIRDHAFTDNLIKASGIAYTIIQPNSFFQNLYGSLSTINDHANFYMPFSDVAHSLVDLNDVAMVITKALTEEGHENKTYVLTGNKALTYAEQAKLLTKVSGKTINYIAVSKADSEKGLKEMGMDDWSARHLAELMGWFVDADFYHETTDTIEDILRRKPRSFEEFAKEFSYSIKNK